MAKFESDTIAGDMRRAAAYWDKRDIAHRARLLRQWADEIDPPAIKCTYSGCDGDALFRVELSSPDDESGRLSFRCADHVVVWLSCNAPFGTIEVDLL